MLLCCLVAADARPVAPVIAAGEVVPPPQRSYSPRARRLREFPPRKLLSSKSLSSAHRVRCRERRPC
ncbi:hypothetical protein MRX96_000539 [Rhipicephalus microplus]